MSRLSEEKGYSVLTICEYVGISRQAYYKRVKVNQTKAILYRNLIALVRENRRHKSRAGLRAIYYKENLSSLLGVNRFEREMSKQGLALKPYKSLIKTTDSRGHFYKFDNLISGLEVRIENRVIVGDITYYESCGELYYIFQFRDYYTLEIKGLVGSKTMEGIHAEQCLRQVLIYNKIRKYKYFLIIHTDEGTQYRSHAFQRMLQKAEILPSHAKNCLENGLSERTNGILKNEYLVDYEIKSLKHLNEVLVKIKYQINEVWPSSKLGYLTPVEFAKKMRALPPKERISRTIKEVELKRWVL